MCQLLPVRSSLNYSSLCPFFNFFIFLQIHAAFPKFWGPKNSGPGTLGILWSPFYCSYSLGYSQHQNIKLIKNKINEKTVVRKPYYKNKLEMKSNLNEILPVNYKLICFRIFLVCAESQT